MKGIIMQSGGLSKHIKVKLIYIKDKENAAIFDEAPDSQIDETLGMIHQFNPFIHSFSQSIPTAHVHLLCLVLC